MAHTPGPWEYAELLPDGIIIKRGGAFEIRTDSYDVCTLVPNRGPIRKEDDARLIAAAPELLEACKSAHTLLEALRMDNGAGDFLTESQQGIFQATEHQLRAAICKAEGA